MAFIARANGVASAPRVLLVGLCLSLFAAPAAAHDFWIEPQSFAVAPGTDVAFTLLVGHGSERQRSAIPRGRIVRFDAIGRGGNVTDMRADLTLGGEAGDGAVRF